MNKGVLTAIVAVLLLSLFQSAAMALDDQEFALLDLINDYRGENGLKPVLLSPSLSYAAQFHSNWMANNNCFAHQCGLEPDLGQRLLNADYRWDKAAAENIAAGRSGASRTFQQWVNSPNHNRAMLDSRWKALGIGRAYNSSAKYRWYWTVDFSDVADVKYSSELKMDPGIPAAMGSFQGQVQFEVFDLSGRLVQRASANAQGLSRALSAALPNGVYLYVVTARTLDGTRTSLKKLVVLR